MTVTPLASRANLSGFRWFFLVATIAIVVALPVLSIFWLALFPEENIWPHLLDTVLLHYVSATLILAVGVAALTLVAGVGSAWLVSMCRFPGRVFLSGHCCCLLPCPPM